RAAAPQVFGKSVHCSGQHPGRAPPPPTPLPTPMPPCLRTAMSSSHASTRRIPHWRKEIGASGLGVHQLGGGAEQISGGCGANATDAHSRRFFWQSSRYLRARVRSLSLASASALVYLSVIQVSSRSA